MRDSVELVLALLSLGVALVILGVMVVSSFCAIVIWGVKVAEWITGVSLTC